jgi:hypothetical protein
MQGSCDGSDVRPGNVLLGPHPFFSRLRRRSLFFVHRSIQHQPDTVREVILVPFRAEALQRSPGSRVCCFSACEGSKTTQDQLLARNYRKTVMLPSSNQERVGVLILR